MILFIIVVILFSVFVGVNVFCRNCAATIYVSHPGLVGERACRCERMLFHYGCHKGWAYAEQLGPAKSKQTYCVWGEFQ
jgi:hypothetical protein